MHSKLYVFKETPEEQHSRWCNTYQVIGNRHIICHNNSNLLCYLEVMPVKHFGKFSQKCSYRLLKQFRIYSIKRKQSVCLIEICRKPTANFRTLLFCGNSCMEVMRTHCSMELCFLGSVFSAIMGRNTHIVNRFIRALSKFRWVIVRVILGFQQQ